MSVNTSDLDYIRKLVYSNAAIVVDKGKDYLIESRLLRIVRQVGVGSISELVAILKNNSFNRLHLQVVEAMTTNETSFFRDIHPFEALHNQVLPELIKSRSKERKLCLWCAACSSGQEPYSIAMILGEMAHELKGWSVKVLATDISMEMLSQAQEGVYNQLQVGRGMPAPMLGKYFKKMGDEWQINDELRRIVEFYQVNLAGKWPSFPRLDVIFLRNVLYYFDDDTKKIVLSKTSELMKPDSYLFLGATETPIFLSNSFERVKLGKAICYRLR